jgi:release factor family 3
MPTTKVEPAQALNWSELKELCASAGPCITIMLGAHHPGAHTLSYAVRLRNAIRAAGQELPKFTSPGQMDELLAPLHDLADDPAMSAGGGGMVIFCAPGVFSRFQPPAAVTDAVVVGQHFYIVPLVGMLGGEREFFILGVGQKGLRLLHYLDGRCEAVLLPASVPRNVEEAGAFDQPDHTLENRSTAGKSAGSLQSVPFGTGSERETAGEHLHHFFRLVDKGLAEVLKGRPLLLAGVEYEVSVYRRASRYPHVLDGDLPGDLRRLPVEEIQRLAGQYAGSRATEEAEEALREFREKPERVVNDVATVVRAAGQGQIAKLILAECANASSGDVLNTAAVLTIRNGGRVFLLPAERIDGSGLAAAIFRY